MQQPPGPGPDDLTQPIPVVRPGHPRGAQPPPPPPPRPPSGGDGKPPRPGPYDHRIGNVPAYLLARLGAFAVDVFGVAFLVATFITNGVSFGLLTVGRHDTTEFDAVALASLGVALIFAFACELLFNTTLGKLIFGLHVRRANGRRAGPGRVFVRNLMRPIDALAVGPLLALVTPRRQRLGDLLAGTVVGRSPIGAFATVLGIVFVCALAYAQVLYGGGLTSAVTVGAETAIVVPQLYGRAAAAVPLASPTPSHVPATPAGAPSPEATDTPDASASDSPEASASDAPEAASSETPEASASAAPEATASETPEASAPGAPSSAPTDPPSPRASSAVINPPSPERRSPLPKASTESI